MNTVSHLLLLLLVSFGLASCATQGNIEASKSETLSSFVKGSTTKREVHAKLGQPHNVWPKPSPGARWSYYYVTTQMNGLGLIPVAGLFLSDVDTTSTITQLTFDKKDRFAGSTITRGAESHNSFASVGRGIKAFSSGGQSVRVKEEMQRLNLPYDKEHAIRAQDSRTILGNSDPSL